MEQIFLKVTVDGEDVSDLLERLHVEESDNRTNMASLTFGDSQLVLADLLCEGLSVEIDLGRPDAHAVVFRGFITGLQANFPSRGYPEVTVQVMDSLIQLGFQPKTHSWRNATIHQIVQDIAVANGLVPGKIEAEADEAVEEMRPRQQLEQTDLAFLLNLAQEYDSKLYINHQASQDTLNFVSTQRLLEAEPLDEVLSFNANLESFSVSLETSNTATETRLVTTDPQTGDRVEIQETLVRPNEEFWTPDAARIARVGGAAERLSRLADRVTEQQARLRQFWRHPPREVGAASRSNENRSRTFGDRSRRLGQTGQGQTRGSIWLHPYRRVRIEGCGGRWSGDWYVAEVDHQIDLNQQNYLCSFTCTR